MNFLCSISFIVSTIFIVLLIYRIVTEIRDNYENEPEDPFVLSLIQEIRQISPEVDDVVKRLKFFKGRKSYTINKKNVYLCKNDENGMLYGKNQLVLVLIHEISHALCSEIGHTPSFYKIMDNLLIKAEKHKLYDPAIQHVENYCPGPE